MKNFLIGITGASGGGKTTVINQLIDRNSSFCRIPTYTTRSKREGEKEGGQYQFISKLEYAEMQEQGKLIACSVVGNEYYGAPTIDINSKIYDNKNLVIDIGSTGALELKKAYRDSLFIYLIPPNKEKLMQRMEQRGPDRLERSKKQIAIAKKACKWMIINNNLEETIKEIEELIEILTYLKCNPKSIQKLDKQTLKFLYERSLYNKRNIQFLDNFYIEKKLEEEIDERA